MRRMQRIRWLAVPALAAGCALSSTDAADLPADQDFLFEVEYVNYAWGFVWKGAQVDRNGDVWAYALEAPWDHSGAASFTEDELRTKYDEGRTRIGQVESAELGRMFAKVAAAAAGPLDDPVQRCADAGGVAFVAWSFDTSTARYTPVVLREEGDVARANRSPEADELQLWLKSIAPGFGISGCQP